MAWLTPRINAQISFSELYRQPHQNEAFSTGEIIDSLRVLAAKKKKDAFVRVPGACIVTAKKLPTNRDEALRELTTGRAFNPFTVPADLEAVSSSSEDDGSLPSLRV